MNPCIKNLFPCLGVASCAAWACLGVASMRSRVLPALIAALGLIPAGRVTAQTFTTLHSFTATPASSPYINSDGAYPNAGLILSGNTLYGTANYGGSSGRGTVFKVNTNGTGFTILHSFTAPSPNSSGYPTNSDGANPLAGLILSGNTLYGSANVGGRFGRGAVFAVNTNGTGFTNLHNFPEAVYDSSSGSYTNSEGAYPWAGLTLSGNTLYGTTANGGSAGWGTVFALNTDGTGFTNLHSFNSGSDGARPFARLILSGNTLYGTAREGGSSFVGTVFALNTDGTGFTNLHNFTDSSDGKNPISGLVLSGNTLYGTVGKVFKVNTDGTGFTFLTNVHGSQDGLVLSGNTLYGTTGGYFGSSDSGTVFAVNTDDTGFTTLHTFSPNGPSVDSYTNSDGVVPAGLILSSNTLYGTAYRGGSSGNGTIFSLSLPPVSAPQLTIFRSGANVILTWPANAAGFTLQSTTNLVSPAVWSSVSPGPVIADGQNTVTNPISGAQKFYRLSQ
jgi:uncharacterized repeat protein (TIGR03803 family)